MTISISERTTMKKTAHGLIMLALANFALCQCFAQSTTQIKAFTDWPAGRSPVDVGPEVRRPDQG
jgi:hypothetical protein